MRLGSRRPAGPVVPITGPFRASRKSCGPSGPARGSGPRPRSWNPSLAASPISEVHATSWAALRTEPRLENRDGRRMDRRRTADRPERSKPRRSPVERPEAHVGGCARNHRHAGTVRAHRTQRPWLQRLRSLAGDERGATCFHLSDGPTAGVRVPSASAECQCPPCQRERVRVRVRVRGRGRGGVPCTRPSSPPRTLSTDVRSKQAATGRTLLVELTEADLAGQSRRMSAESSRGRAGAGVSGQSSTRWTRARRSGRDVWRRPCRRSATSNPAPGTVAECRAQVPSVECQVSSASTER